MNKTIKVIDEAHGENWSIYRADCVDFLSQMPASAIDISIFSPPFSNIFIYSDSEADMGNALNHAEFFEQYRFLLAELFRTTKEGRISCVHCSDLPNHKYQHGHASLYDFPGELIRAHVDAGWLYHSRVTIWKDPVVEMQRTKAHGLLWKQIRKDSTMNRMGMPDYMLIFRKPGENPAPVGHTREEFPVEQWQKWASPVWMDIQQTNVLNVQMGRDQKDEKHICPLQLDVIERCLVMWSNPGDVVYSPFMGIGSEGYQSVKYDRRFIGTELKESYFNAAKVFLTQAEATKETLFDLTA